MKMPMKTAYAMGTLRQPLRCLWAGMASMMLATVAQASLHTVTALPREQALIVSGDASPADDLQAGKAVRQALQLLAQGDRVRALELLAGAEQAIERAPTASVRAGGHALLGRAYLQTGQLDQAEVLIRRSIDIAAAANLPALRAGGYNDLGLLQVARNDDVRGLQSFAAGLEPAQQYGDHGLAARLQLNAADVHSRRGDTASARALFEGTLDSLALLPRSPERARLRAAVASRLLALPEAASGQDGKALAMAGSALAGALEDARQSSDRRAESEALGLTGGLRQIEGDDAAAIRDTRRAIFAAQAAQAPELLYRWEWQAAKLLARRGRIEEAFAFYRRALVTLQPIQHDLLLDLRATRASYRDTIGPLFTEFADQLLQRSARLDGNARSALLLEARTVLEQLKTVELQDYFRDDCVADFQAKGSQDQPLPVGTAVLYPVILRDRLELLLSIGEQIERVSVRVSAQDLRAEVLLFRNRLEQSGDDDYLQPGQRLYSWLIAPLLDQLAAAKIDTLVVVPDGPLLGIPFAALHDGEDFLVEQFAVATAPGLHLVERRTRQQAEALPLFGGLSESVQGYPALPSVVGEIDELSRLYQSGTTLRDGQFTAAAMEKTAGATPFSVVHIASHGQFDSDPRKTFLLTYDGKIGMDALERMVKFSRTPDDPVDLLTLSACQTAVGDERAALGLAGAAIKAGARSVVATLWFINDEASSELIKQFYRALLIDKLPKAKALQLAQQRLMTNPRYRHPRYWAPFLVVGNWT